MYAPIMKRRSKVNSLNRASAFWYFSSAPPLNFLLRLFVLVAFVCASHAVICSPLRERVSRFMPCHRCINIICDYVCVYLVCRCTDRYILMNSKHSFGSQIYECSPLTQTHTHTHKADKKWSAFEAYAVEHKRVYVCVSLFWSNYLAVEKRENSSSNRIDESDTYTTYSICIEMYWNHACTCILGYSHSTIASLQTCLLDNEQCAVLNTHRHTQIFRMN